MPGKGRADADMDGETAVVSASARSVVPRTPAQEEPPLEVSAAQDAAVGSVTDPLPELAEVKNAAAEPAIVFKPSPQRGRDPGVHGRAIRAVAAIDRLLSQQLDLVLHNPALQRLEALWRGVAWLVDGMGDDPKVKLRILDVRWSEVARDLERALSFDQSVLFDKIYSAEFGSPGGEPFGLLIVDHQILHRTGGRERTDDVSVLGALSEVAAAAFCPTILGVDPRMLGLDGFDEIDLRQDVAGTLAGAEYARWERLRGQPDTRFLGAVVPRLLARARHFGRDFPRLGFVYDEAITGPQDLLWLNGGFGLAQVAARAMRVHRWPAGIRGAIAVGEGGVIDGPIRQYLPSDHDRVVARYAVENAISEEQEVALNASGLMAIRQMHLTSTVGFLNLPSIHRPPEYDGEAARMNAKMSAMLNYIMCVCRFAHYVKVMARDWVGKYTDANECQRLLQAWLSNYVTGNDDASAEMRLRYPLREARVLVSEMPGKPGTYGCEIAIRPHYQLDQIASEFRLTTVLGRELGGS